MLKPSIDELVSTSDMQKEVNLAKWDRDKDRDEGEHPLWCCCVIYWYYALTVVTKLKYDFKYIDFFRFNVRLRLLYGEVQQSYCIKLHSYFQG